MGIIVSRKKKSAPVLTQSSSITHSPPPDHFSDNEDRRQHLCDVIEFDSDDENESDSEKELETNESQNDLDTQRDDKSSGKSEVGDHSSSHSSGSAASVSSKETDKDDPGACAVGKNDKDSSIKASEVEEFTIIWEKALLDDLDIKISDDVRVVRIFTSSTFTGIDQECSLKYFITSPGA